MERRCHIVIEGQRCAGKTTLLCKLANVLFMKGLTVSMIPEWSLKDYGPTNPQEWLETVFNERNRLQKEAFESNSTVVLIDRSILGIEALVNAQYPEYSQFLDKLMTTSSFNYPEIFIYLTAKRDELKRRAIKREGHDRLLNQDSICLSYQNLFEKYGIEPLCFDTSELNIEDIIDAIVSRINHILKSGSIK